MCLGWFWSTVEHSQRQVLGLNERDSINYYVDLSFMMIRGSLWQLRKTKNYFFYERRKLTKNTPSKINSSSFLSLIVSLPFSISWGKKSGQPLCKYSLAGCHAEAGQASWSHLNTNNCNCKIASFTPSKILLQTLKLFIFGNYITDCDILLTWNHMNLKS